METANQPKTFRDLKEPGEELGEEARQVFEWRRDELREMGYTQHDAVEIAYSKIDLNDLRTLVKRGATLAQAWRILKGTDFLGDEADTSRLLSPSEKAKQKRTAASNA